jgi:hypothetical protein
VEQIGNDIVELPDDARDLLLQRNIRATRLALVPAYRFETLFGRPFRCFHTYLLLASGTGATDAEGTGRIAVDPLLHCIGQGRPMHAGLHPFPPDGTTVPGRPVVSGAPIVVVTGRATAPVVFSVSREESPVDLDNAGPGFVHATWASPSPPRGTASADVTISGFRPDGSAAVRVPFDWHLTIELVFAVSTGG